MALTELMNETPAQRLEQEVVEWTESVYEEAERELQDSPSLKLTAKLIDYIHGRQWSPQTRFGRSRPVNNRLFRQFIEMVGLLCDIEPDFAVKFYDHPEGFSELEKILNEMISMWAVMSDFEMELSQVVIFGLLHTGYAKIQWNPELSNNQGDNQFLPISPVNLLVVGAQSRIQQAEVIIFRQPVTLASLKRKYGAIADGIRPDAGLTNAPAMMMRPAKMSSSQWSKLPKSLQNLLGVKQGEGVQSKHPVVLQKEFWMNDDCVALNTKVLTADLRWINASEIKVGDELVGCDEETVIVNKARDRWVRRVKVERAYKVIKPSLRIVTDKGTVECSESHRWLGTVRDGKKKRNLDWRFSGEMEVGDKIAFFGEPWEEDKSWDAGYLAGLFDGEGWCTNYAVGFGQAQHNSVILEKAAEFLRNLGFDCRVYMSKKLWRNQKSPTMSFIIRGGRNECMRFIGSTRPRRLLQKSHALWEGKQLRYKKSKTATILSIEKIGDIELMAIKTDRSTFIANGLVSHNSTLGGSESIVVGNPLANWSYIVEPGMPIYPRGRLVTTAGRKVLEDNTSPYWHGMKPFGQYRPYRVPWQLEGLSSLEPIAAIQNILNRINGGVMDTVIAAIEPTLIAPKAAFSDQSWDTMDPGQPGGKLRYNNNTPKPPEFRKPPELAAYVLQFKQDLEKEQDATSGSAAIQQALQKKQVPGGDSLDMIISSKSTNIRLMGKGLKSFLTDIGSMVSANLLQFSSAKRRARLFGGAGLTDGDFEPAYGEMKPHSMKPEDFVKSMCFSIRKLNLNIERADETQIMFGLRKNHDLSRRHLLLHLDANFDVKQNEDELATEALQQAAVQQLTGGGKPPAHGKK